MKERIELIENLKKYRAEFAMSYDAGLLMDRLIEELEQEEKQ